MKLGVFCRASGLSEPPAPNLSSIIRALSGVTKKATSLFLSLIVEIVSSQGFRLFLRPNIILEPKE